MAEDHDQTQGWPLAEALKRFADPDKWRAFAEVADAEQPPRESEWLPRGTGWLRRHAPATPNRNKRTPEQQRIRWQQRQAAWQDLVADFRAKLVSGELVASGYDPRRMLDSGRADLPAEAWERMRFNFRCSSAKWHGHEILDVEVRRRTADVEQTPQRAPSRTLRDQQRKRRRRGRPSLMGEIAAELERRAAAGELCRSQAEQCHVLHDWALDEQEKGNLPAHQVPKTRSIEKSIAGRYQELKEKKRRDNRE